MLHRNFSCGDIERNKVQLVWTQGEMSTSTSAVGLAAHKQRRSSCKVIPIHVFVSAAVACLVLGCAWTLYANVFGASVYPQLRGANFDASVIRRPAIAVRSALSAANTLIADF